jgi:hypothetical protein
MNVVVSYESASAGNADAYADALLKGCWRHRPMLADAPSGRLSRILLPVDYLRLLFATTVAYVPRTRKLETRSGPVQRLRREFPGACGNDALAAHRCQVSALP